MAKLLILISEHSYNINYEKYLRFTQSERYTETRQSPFVQNRSLHSNSNSYKHNYYEHKERNYEACKIHNV